MWHTARLFWICSAVHTIIALIITRSIPGECPGFCNCTKDRLTCKYAVENFEYLLSNRRFLSEVSMEASPVSVKSSGMDLTVFENSSTTLKTLALSECELDSMTASTSVTFPLLRSLSLIRNQLHSLPANLSLIFPVLERISLSGNRFTTLSGIQWPNSLTWLDISANRLSVLPAQALDGVSAVRFLNLSHNGLESISSDLVSSMAYVEVLDLGHNAFTTVDQLVPLLRELVRLRFLNLSGNPLTSLQGFDLIPLRSLSELYLEQTLIYSVNLEQFTEFRALRVLSVARNTRLTAVLGTLASVRQLSFLYLNNCVLKSLPVDFFEGIADISSIPAVLLFGNPWACDCRLAWLNVTTTNNIHSSNTTVCATPLKHKGIPVLQAWEQFLNNGFEQTCNIGIATHADIAQGYHGENIFVECPAFGNPAPNITWEYFSPRSLIGVWDPVSWRRENYTNLEPDSMFGPGYRILPGGTLLIAAATRNHLGLYRCTAENRFNSTSMVVALRFDYSAWTLMKWYSVLVGIATGFGFFILNCVYAGIRALILWRISRMERTSRVRMLLASIEKYKQRQLETLHETYQKRVQRIRENYHHQLDSMSNSISHFRDYRSARYDAMSQQFDRMHDSYSSQVQRMRDYGSKQMERLYESYQAQMNRIRAFSLQQRLRIMRQYKIKQRYLDKLLKSLNFDQCRTGAESDFFGANELMDFPPNFDGEFPGYIPPADFDDDDLSLDFHSLPGDDVILRTISQEDIPDIDDSPSTSSGIRHSGHDHFNRA